jgi:VWFA-related protein
VKWGRIYLLALMFLAALACPVGMCGQVSAPQAAGTVTYWITATNQGHLVTDLKKEDLQLWIGKQEQSISDFTFNPPEPLQVGLLFDTSGSLRDRWPGPEISLASGFLTGVLRPGDQAAIMHFEELLSFDTHLTGDLSALDQGLRHLAAVAPHEGTALYDAIEGACEQLEVGGPAHRALVVITDGGENASLHRLDQAMTVVGRTGTQLYFIGRLRGREKQTMWEHRYMKVLRSLADATGGQLFLASNKLETESGFNSIAKVLRAQYALEFQSAGVSPSKKGNRIKIQCSRPGVEILAPERGFYLRVEATGMRSFDIR